MDDPTTQRRARQILSIDRLFGMDAVPVSSREPAAEAASAEATERGAPAADQALFGARPLKESNMSTNDKAAAMAALAQEHTEQCPHCSPQRGQLNMVFGEGDPDAGLMFIGEGPGQEEDRLGRPFVGRAGQLLDKQIIAMGLEREQVYIANIVKCRPPGNRVPTPEEAEMCMPYLERQVEIIQPAVIVALGATSAKLLLEDPKLAITRMRGQWQTYRQIDLMPTFHPAYLLRSYTPENRRHVWDDLQQVMRRLGLPAPAGRE